MESAALLFLLALKTATASSLGVMFGWQPMPDGSAEDGRAKIEYIVQIEPELAATLHAGQSIPITSDIPEDIGPIGRIRIVVGREELPRQKLVTDFKPWPETSLPKASLPKASLPKASLSEKQSRDTVVETQYRVQPVEGSGDGRYGNQAATNNTILPPGGNGAISTNPLARSLQQGAQNARNLAADAKQQILPPTGNQLFGQGGTNGQGVRNAINNTTNQLRQGLEQDVQQVAERTGQQLRQAVNNVGQQALEKVDQYGRPTSSQRSILSSNNGNSGQSQSSATILPPNSTAGVQALGSQARGGQITPKSRQRIDEPTQPRQPSDWQRGNSAPPANFAAGTTPQQTNPQQANPSSQPGVFNAPWPSTTGTPPVDTTVVSNTPTGRYGNQASQPPSWSNQPSGNTANGNPTNTGVQGPQFPSMGTQPPPQQNRGNNWATNSGPPAITREMVEQIGSGGVQTVNNSQGYQSARPPFDSQPNGAQSAGTQPMNTQPRDFGWNDNSGNGTEPSNSKSLFPLLLSWVLLSGSGAGNLYLFWSYLDVRSKYQGMVHGSPSRRDRYDD